MAHSTSDTNFSIVTVASRLGYSKKNQKKKKKNT